MTIDNFDAYDRQGMNWLTTIILALLHLGAIAAFFMFSWTALGTAVFLYWMATGLGISMGYHRLHTHRSYKVPTALEYFFAICGTMPPQARQADRALWNAATHQGGEI